MNYIIISIVICLSLSFIAYKTEKRILNPVTVFCGLWGIIVYLSSLNLYTLYEADMNVYRLIFLGVISFVVGYYSYKIISKGRIIKIRLKRKSFLQCKYALRYRIIYFLALVCIIFIIKDILSLKINIFNGEFNLKNVQQIVREQSVDRGGLENAIRFLIITPLYFAIPVLTGIDIWFGKKDKRLFVLTVLILIGRVLTTGGREGFIKFFFVLFIGYSFVNVSVINNLKEKIKKRKNKRIFTGIFFLTVFCLIFLSLSRAGDQLIKTIYLDFAMQPTMFQIWASRVEDANLYGYGFASLNGFFYPILYFLKNFLRVFSEIPVGYAEIYNMTMATEAEWVSIGRTLHANAYVSVFWFLYLDGRSIGVILGMIIYGVVSYHFYNIAYKKRDMKSVSMYSIILIGIFYTFGRMEFTKQTYVIGLLFIAICAYKKEVSLREVVNKENESKKDND